MKDRTIIMLTSLICLMSIKVIALVTGQDSQSIEDLVFMGFGIGVGGPAAAILKDRWMTEK